MRAFDTVVFDLDGTLLDTLEDLYQSVNRALAAHGQPARGRDEVCLFTGNGIRRLIERSVGEGRPDVDPAVTEAVFEDFKRDYAAHCEDHTAPYPGIPQMVANLRAAGVACAVVSNKADFAVQELVQRHFPDAFDAVLGENEAAGIRKKPAPDMVDAALERLGRGREGLAYVGDSEVDIQTAAACACSCVSCTWGFRSREWLLDAGATLLVNTPSELERVLLGNA